MRHEIAKRFEDSIAVTRERLDDLRSVLEIPEDIDIVPWIEDNVRIPSTVSTEGGGPLFLFGFQKGIARLAMHPDTKWLVVPKGTRTGITQLFTAINCYKVFYKKRPVGFWQPTDEKAEKYDKEYWHATVRESPKLARFIRKPRRGEPQDTWFYRTYLNGGKFLLSSATVDDNFRGDTVSDTNGDEVDAEGWMRGKQGKKFALMWERSRSFWDRKQYIWSSPLDEETSNIWREWLQSDQRHFFVRCPHCGGRQYLKWGSPKSDHGIKWKLNDEGFVEDSWYVCEHNGCIIEEAEKFAMDDEAGEAVYADDDPTPIEERLGWQPTKTPKRPGLVGCHVPGYIILFAGAAWKQLAQEWTDAQGDPEALQTFINNLLGEPWRALELAKQIDIGSFQHRRPIPFANEVPDWVLYLTAYIDVQEGWADEELKLRPRLEIQVVGWGPGQECAQIGHFVLQDHDLFAPEMLRQMDEIVFRRWERADGVKLQVAMCGIDASHRQTEVLSICRVRHRLDVFRAMKGEAETAKDKAPIIINAPKPSESRNVLIRVGTRRAKDLANRLLRNESPGPYHLHIPRSIAEAVDTDDGRPGFFDSLFAEKPVLRNGIETWERKSKMNTGEVWDCLVGNVATIELAMLTHPKRVGRAINDMTPQPPRDRYEGEDNSVMADVLAAKRLKDFEGDSSWSILPPRGEVNLPDHLISATPIAIKPRPRPAPAKPQSGLRVRPNPLLDGVEQREPQRSSNGGLQVRRAGLQVRRTRL